MLSPKKEYLSVLFGVLLAMSCFAVYSLGIVGLIVPLSALTFFVLLCLFLGFERVLMHAVTYFSFSLLFALAVFGFFLFFPELTVWSVIVLTLLFVFAVAIAVWRYYKGMLGRIQLYRWLS